MEIQCEENINKLLRLEWQISFYGQFPAGKKGLENYGQQNNLPLTKALISILKVLTLHGKDETQTRKC